MPTPEDIRSAVDRYLTTIQDGTSAEVAALYAEDATLEDPVGTQPLTGRDAISKFYSALDPLNITTKLDSVRVAGSSAAFGFSVVVDTGESLITTRPIDVMTFDENAQITSMRAFWSQSDVTVA